MRGKGDMRLCGRAQIHKTVALLAYLCLGLYIFMDRVHKLSSFIRYLGPPSVQLSRDARSELLNRRIDADLLDKLCLGWELQPTEIQTIMSSDSLAAWVLLFRSRKTSIERIVDASRKMPLSQREIVKCRILNECERRGYGSVLEYEKFRLEAFVSGELVGVELSETDRSETAKPL